MGFRYYMYPQYKRTQYLFKRNFAMHFIAHMRAKTCMTLIRHGPKLLAICEMMYCRLVNFKYQTVTIYHYYCSTKF